MDQSGLLPHVGTKNADPDLAITCIDGMLPRHTTACAPAQLVRDKLRAAVRRRRRPGRAGPRLRCLLPHEQRCSRRHAAVAVPNVGGAVGLPGPPKHPHRSLQGPGERGRDHQLWPDAHRAQVPPQRLSLQHAVVAAGSTARGTNAEPRWRLRCACVWLGQPSLCQGQGAVRLALGTWVQPALVTPHATTHNHHNPRAPTPPPSHATILPRAGHVQPRSGHGPPGYSPGEPTCCHPSSVRWASKYSSDLYRSWLAWPATLWKPCSSQGRHEIEIVAASG